MKSEKCHYCSFNASIELKVLLWNTDEISQTGNHGALQNTCKTFIDNWKFKKIVDNTIKVGQISDIFIRAATQLYCV